MTIIENLFKNSWYTEKRAKKWERRCFLTEEYKILREMWPENRLVVIIATLTGLTISDAVGLRSCQLQGEYIAVGLRKYWIPAAVMAALRRISDGTYVFPHRDYAGRHRTRQAVYRDMLRACRQIGTKRFTPAAVARLYKPL